MIGLALLSLRTLLSQKVNCAVIRISLINVISSLYKTNKPVVTQINEILGFVGCKIDNCYLVS
jgi:hypothetical protein